MGRPLRVAFFPDTYDEIDGVANTSRQFEAFAKRRGWPFLVVHGGARDGIEPDGSVIRLIYRRGRIGFPVDKKHDFDLAFWRHYDAIKEAVRKFDPDILHITGPSDVGQLGALVAHRLQIPLAASWHTNLHEYAERRACSLLWSLPESWRERMGSEIRKACLTAILRFYRIAQILFAPNPELMNLLQKGTGKPCYPMERGVDTVLFNPERRDRSKGGFVIGYVGRLTVEKNIRFLAELERALKDAGLEDCRFLIVGQGAEDLWLKANMQNADFAGVLRGTELARAYANMDVFVFPSKTDTYGNVVLEALASGVPAVVSDCGGPQFVVSRGETGFVAKSQREFVDYVRILAGQKERLRLMQSAARSYALRASWDKVFDDVYAGYARGLRGFAAPGKNVTVRQRPGVARPELS
jgi:phosphatidylinositol alpha 1,6-mannosyltransferase